MANEKPVRIKVSDRTQCGDLFIYKEGKGMCQNGIVVLAQRGFSEDRQEVRFEIAKVKRVIAALQKLPEMTSANQDEFQEDMVAYLGED
jgi:hypothetical protein